MRNVRIIPRLDIKGPNLVKGIHLEGLRVMGPPEEFARAYADAGADELLYVDTVASLYGRNSILSLVERTARDIFVPLMVGGGLRSLGDIKAALRAGADKVSLNTAAVRDPELVRNAASHFGSSTVVLSVEAKRQPDGRYEAYTDNGRERTGLDAVEWAVRGEALGAGEILVTSIDREGTGQGYEIDLVRAIAARVSVPVVASGGAGSPDDVAKVVQEGHADAVAVAGMFHYGRVARSFGPIQATTVQTLKRFLIEHGLPIRPPEDGASHA